jgi:hypothetical protein
MLVSSNFLIGMHIDVLFPITVALLAASNFLNGASSIIRILVDSEAGFHETVLNL